MDYIPSVHGILQARTLEWVAYPPPGDLPDPGAKSGSPAVTANVRSTIPSAHLCHVSSHFTLLLVIPQIATLPLLEKSKFPCSLHHILSVFINITGTPTKTPLLTYWPWLASCLLLLTPSPCATLTQLSMTTTYIYIFSPGFPMNSSLINTTSPLTAPHKCPKNYFKLK